MKKILDIQLAPTPYTLDVLFGDDIDEISEYIDSNYDFDKEEGDYYKALELRKGFCDEVYDENGMRRILVYVKDKEDLITIAHEVLHVTWYIQYWTGFNFSWDSQEIQAYLLEYIMKEIFYGL